MYPEDLVQTLGASVSVSSYELCLVDLEHLVLVASFPSGSHTLLISFSVGSLCSEGREKFFRWYLTI